MCGRCVLEDVDVEQNRKLLTALRSGEAFKYACGWRLAAGSRAEGLALSFWWGHARSDRDWMHLYGGGLGVCIPDEGPSAEGTNLVFSAQGCPAAYCRVQVNDVGEFCQSVAKVNLPLGGLVCRNLVPGCVVEERNCHWLDSQCLLKVLQGSGDIIGPAGQLYGGQWEFVPTLVCSGPHPGMDEYRNRPRKGWPTGAQVDSLTQLPMLLVLVGFKGSEDFPKQMRVSWSHLELELIICLPEWVKQGYLAFKYSETCFTSLHKWGRWPWRTGSDK